MINLCRICLKSDCKEESFGSIIDSEAALKIFNVSGVQVLREDEPSFICHECRTDLTNADEFRDKCLKAEDFFRQATVQKLQVESNFDLEATVEYSFLDDEETILEDSDTKMQARKRKVKTSSQTKPKKITKATSNSCVCPECLKTFSNQSYLKKHKYFCHSVIPPEDLLVCDYCGLQTKTKQLIRNHIAVAHSRKPKEKFICKTCGKMLSTKGNLESHEKSHVFIDPSEYIPCTVCAKSFREKRFMIEHLKLVHEKSKAIQCPHCPHISTCKGAYNTHFKSVHLKCRDFICTDCGLGFSTNSQLTRHYRIHTGERPFECKSCAKPFRLSSHRKRHEEICGKRFSIKEDL